MVNHDGSDHAVRIKILQTTSGNFHLPDFMMSRVVIDWSKDSWLILGDSLEVMKDMPDGTCDLIYNDPPFNSNMNYKANKKFYKWIHEQRMKRGYPEMGQREKGYILQANGSGL